MEIVTTLFDTEETWLVKPLQHLPLTNLENVEAKRRSIFTVQDKLRTCIRTHQYAYGRASVPRRSISEVITFLNKITPLTTTINDTEHHIPSETVVTQLYKTNVNNKNYQVFR